MINIQKINRRQGGFTLAEIQVVSVIVFVIFLAMFALYILYSRTFAVGSTLLDVYANSRIAVALLARDIRAAAQVEASNGSYTTSDSSIVLKVPSVDSAGNVISAKFDEIIYKLQGQELYRIVIPSSSSSRISTNRAVANNCASLTFSSGGVTLSNISSSNLSNINTIEINLPISRTILSLSGTTTVSESMVPTTTVKLRNK